MPFFHSADTFVPAQAAKQIDELVVMLIVRVIILTAPAAQAASPNRLGPHAGRYHGSKVAPEQGVGGRGAWGSVRVLCSCQIENAIMRSNVKLNSSELILHK